MGRKRVVRTADEMEAMKTKYWGPERNERRTRRYHEDPAYRETAQQWTRNTYRRKRQEAGATVRNDDCAENIERLDDIGAARVVHSHADKSDTLMVTLTVEEMAAALNRNQQVLYRWFANDMFPRPTVTAATPHNKHQHVYTKEEAIAAMRVFSAHQEHSQYYRERHMETRDKIFDAVFAVRANLAQKGIGT